jgi:hypothetical protein
MTTRVIFFSFLFASSINSFAQRVIDVDKFEGSALHFFKAVGGEPLMNTKFVKLVEGTPYFTDRWIKGSVFIDDNEYRNFYLRVNIMETTLEFMDRKGEQMICTMPVKRVILTDSLKETQYRFVHSAFLPDHPEAKKSWLLELVSGTAKLYKLEKKQVNEIRPYGSATTEQHIVNSYVYFVLNDKEIKRIKKLSDVSDLLASKKDMLDEYIKTNRLNAKSEKDLIRLIEYYNTLQ